MYLILTRHDRYLTERYQWGNLPALFPDWQTPDVMQMMDKAEERPTGWAMVEDAEVVDLDKLEVMPL